MSRRSGQDPSVRIGKRADGSKYFYFQYYVDVAGQEERQRKTEVVGAVGQMTKHEAMRKKLEFISNLKLNSSEYRIPSTRCFADTVKYYRDEFAPRHLRASTAGVANTHIKVHLEPDWKDVPIEHITIENVNVWAWKKRQTGLSWTTIQNILRTMQRVLSCSSKNKNPPFSLKGLDIPEQDRMDRAITSRNAVSFSWADSKRIANAVGRLSNLDPNGKRRYAAAFLVASATGLRCSELFGLRMDDLDFRANTVRVDEAFDGRTYTMSKCKNVAAYRTIYLGDHEGREALKILKAFVAGRLRDSSAFVFPSKHGTPMRETVVLRDALHPALKAIGLPQAGMHAFRRGCNRRWELAGMNPAVQRQMMGHSSASMTAHYTGQIPMEQIRADFSGRNGPRIVVSENKENRRAA